MYFQIIGSECADVLETVGKAATTHDIKVQPSAGQQMRDHNYKIVYAQHVHIMYTPADAPPLPRLEVDVTVARRFW